jgi:isopentenyl diphosphate isomerase/L-lactate dehydrogenase-like FMN-dependent dehydrogenase
MSDDAVNLGDLERQARVVMRKADIDYFDGGAEDELTLRNNVDAFSAVTLWPRVMVRQTRDCVLSVSPVLVVQR